MLPIPSINLPNLPNLPDSLIAQLVTTQTLLVGLLKSQSEFEDFSQEAINSLDAEISKLNDIINLLNNYEIVTHDIAELITKIQDVYNQFTSHETQQYKLLSGNFHQENLKLKFRKIIEKNHQKSLELCKAMNRHGNHTEMEEQLRQFKNSRKVYHLRSEKMNRWNEERVTGFI